MPNTDMTSRVTASSDPTFPTRSRVASSPRERLYSARIGTNACENAPSANMRRRMFGKRNAASKASICNPAPKPTALMLSRISPVMRESKVSALTAESVLSRFMREPVDACRGSVSKGGDLRTWCADAKSFLAKSRCRRDGRIHDGEACERFDPRVQRRWICHESAIRLARIAENRYYARSFSTAPASSEGRRQ